MNFFFKEFSYRIFFDYKIINVKYVYNVNNNAYIIKKFKFEKIIIIYSFNFIIKLFANDSKIFNYIYFIILVQINIYDKKKH